MTFFPKYSHVKKNNKKIHRDPIFVRFLVFQPQLKVTHHLLSPARFFRSLLPRGWHVMLRPDWQHAGRRAGINQMRTPSPKESKRGSVSRCHGATTVRYPRTCSDKWGQYDQRHVEKSHIRNADPRCWNITYCRVSRRRGRPFCLGGSTWRQKQRQDNSLLTLHIWQNVKRERK